MGVVYKRFLEKCAIKWECDGLPLSDYIVYVLTEKKVSVCGYALKLHIMLMDLCLVDYYYYYFCIFSDGITVKATVSIRQ